MSYFLFPFIPYKYFIFVFHSSSFFHLFVFPYCGINKCLLFYAILFHNFKRRMSQMRQNRNKSGTFRSSDAIPICPLALCFFVWFLFVFVFQVLNKFTSCGVHVCKLIPCLFTRMDPLEHDMMHLMGLI